MGSSSTSKDKLKAAPYPTPRKVKGFEYYKQKLSSIVPEVITDPEDFLIKVNDDGSFDSTEINGTLVATEFRVTESKKKLVSLSICGFVDHNISMDAMDQLCSDFKANLSGNTALATKRDLFTCTVWGEQEESCKLEIGKPYSFTNIRKARNFEGSANFDCLIQNIVLIKK